MSETNLNIQRLTPKKEAKKDVMRSIMGFNLLKHVGDLLKNPNSPMNKHLVLEDLEEILKAYVESGGTASELLTRLQGLGIVDDFPFCKQLSSVRTTRNNLRSSNLPSSVLKVESSQDGEMEISATIFFIASPLDKELGQETWRNANADAYPFSSTITLKIASNGLDTAIAYFQAQNDEASVKFKK